MKKIFILILCMMTICLTGCDSGKQPTYINSDNNCPDLTILASDIEDKKFVKYFYVIDNKTGVVYIQYDGYDVSGITVALNSDGSPMTKEQLEIKNNL